MNQRLIALYLPVHEVKILRYIAAWCSQFTPFVCIEHDISHETLNSQKLRRGLILDITGMGRLHTSEERLGKKILEELERRHIPVSLAFASTVGASWALSRFSLKPLAVHGAEPLKSLLSSLPLEALRITEDTVLSLHEVGVFTLGDIFALPIKQLAVRFGLQLVRRVDQILGRIDEPLRIIRVTEQLSSQIQLEYPLSEVIKIKGAVLHLLDDLFGKLRHKGSKASAFHLRFTTEAGNVATRNVSLYLASRNLRHISSIIQPIVESLIIREPVQMISITALNIKPTDKEQGDLDKEGSFSNCDEAQAFGELINILTARLGNRAVSKALLKSSFIPERSYEFVPLVNSSDGSHYQPPSTTATPFIGDRPSYIFHSPEPIKVIAMLPDKPPSWLHWKNQKVKLTKGTGPERISNEWWRDGIHTASGGRDYFKVQDETGRWLWVYRDTQSMEWFIHGIWA